MRYIIWVLCLLLVILYNFCKQVDEKTEKNNCFKRLRRITFVECWLLIIIYLLFCFLDIGSSTNIVFIIVGTVVYIFVLLHIIPSLANTVSFAINSYDYISTDLKEDIDDAVNKVKLLQNGVVANKVNQADYIKTLDSYGCVEEIISSLEENLRGIYENRFSLKLDEVFILKNFLNYTKKSSKKFLDSLIFLDDRSKIDEIFDNLSFNLSGFSLWISVLMFNWSLKNNSISVIESSKKDEE